jgi:hypothetical protein
MPLNFEVKGMLAKLLATEDLVVEHKNVQTACFNVHTRVLTLPMWQKASNTVYDMLVAHEVSHALYTPDEDWNKKVKVPQAVVNVVEDARVEKLIKRRYMGLAKTFYNAYSELNRDDFFSLADENLSKLNLADRVNLHFKIGNFTNIPFNQEELEIVKLVGNTETFDDALEVSEILYKYCTQKEQTQKVDMPELNSHQSCSVDEGSDDENTGGMEDPISSEQLDDTEGNQSESAPDEGEQSTGKNDKSQPNCSPQGGVGSTFDEVDVKTMKSFEDSVKDLIRNTGSDTVYVEVPKVNLDTVIVKNKDLFEYVDDFWSAHSQEPNTFTYVDHDYQKFKKSAQKEVNYLVKEFECRKAADSYARATTSRTGVLDCSKLHTYKYQEDLFMKVTTFSEGKNHGLIFMLDWSGSMCEVMKDTIKQLYNLVWFCKKVNIPFEVYAFTDSFGPAILSDKYGVPLPPAEHTERKENELVVGNWFRLMNLFTSSVRGPELEDQMKKIYRIVDSFRSYGSYPIPPKMGLSGTPLNEAVITLHQILPKFKKDHNLQKVHCVCLTDGEGSAMGRYRMVKRDWEVEYRIGTAYIDPSAYLRDRKTGFVYKFGQEGKTFTDILLLNLRDKFPSVSFIGMRILTSREAGYFIKMYCDYPSDLFDKVMSAWKREKSFSLKNSGYHSYFGISSNALNTSTEFKVEEDSTKAKIKTAFVKSLNSKKMNKKILSEFISLVA